MKALEHWMVQIIEIQMRDADTRKHKIWPTLYDPLGVSSYFDVCQAKWISFTIPVRVLPEVVAVPLLYPKQTDSVSCGMLSIAQAYSYVRHVRSLKTSKSIPQNDITQMRLRLLWTLLHESSAADEDKDVQFWADMINLDETMVAISVQSSLVLLLGLAAVSNATNLRQPNRDLSEMTSTQASALLVRINKERAAHGLPALCSNMKLQAAAQRHVKDQSKTDYMSDTGTDDSTPKQRVTEAGYKWQSVAENIDAGNVNGDAVVDWWMKGTSRDNILGKYTMVGTAYAYNDNTYSKHYWVQVYATGSSEECDA
ncbi:hypothetical protein PC117_g3090 [Phytophthora cactorum]|uniref:SCP domain-containing protein n=2 Tax=Phytophthora cactorum TaxID=29920 RepID=A0A8T1EFC8_9STRA|nr:hypothetical protein PC117_g3090 [Phytophthora cactorum]